MTPRNWTAQILVLIAVLVLTSSRAGSQQNGGAVRDRVGDVEIGSRDIMSASITPVGPETLLFQIDVREPVTLDPGPGFELAYNWHLDVDRNRATGLKTPFVGADYYVSCRYVNRGWQGLIIPQPGHRGGGEVTPFVAGRTLSVRVPLAQIDNHPSFDWEVSLDAIRAGQSIGFDRAEMMASLLLPKPGPYPGGLVSIQLTPPVVLLRNGRLSAPVQAEGYDAGGAPVSLSGKPLQFFVTSPAVARAGAGVVTALPGAFGRTLVVGRAGEVISTPLTVNTGRLEVVPSVLHLTPGSSPSGAVSVRVEDARGNSVRPDGSAFEFTNSQTDVVRLFPDGRLLALSPGKSSGISARVNGIPASNEVYVRVLDNGLVMPAVREYAGKYVALWLPPSISTVKSGQTLNQMAARYDCVGTMDTAYRLQFELTGKLPNDGAMHHLVVIGAEDEARRVHGFSAGGALTGVGLNLNLAPGQNCVQLPPDGVPHWGVWLHEMGHAFTLAHPRFNQVFGGPATAGGPDEWYRETLATMAGMYVMTRLIELPERYGASAATVASMREAGPHGTVGSNRTGGASALAKYEAAGAPFQRAVEAADGMVISIGDELRWANFPRFYDPLIPQELMPFAFDTAPRRATFFVALLSYAFERDLRARFARWGFPIDNAFYAQAMPYLEKEARRGQAIRRALAPQLTGSGG